MVTVRASTTESPDMQRTFIRTIERTLRPFGLDVFIELDDSRQGFFAFERRDHGTAGREYWGFGLHVIVSRLQPLPQ